MKGLRLASFVIKIFCYTLQIQLWTLYYSELKMTEELSKHVLEVSFIFLNSLHVCCYPDLLIIKIYIYFMPS